ncbi:CHAT domain-containing protein [Suillus subalutaceus]|uniref:CHAT domain-containing protein n=1 Tax=Suillus subalutaceus TaxID=48586 RepID=UPI001B867C03|nr:CHAT domain-containing protein [Suillus subalutaceus]KAG1878090.1 CHAT domain-containing protein [Suillus subalutaceus]
MPSSLEGQSIRLEVINGKNLQVPSGRIPAGIYVSINVGSRRRWKSAIKVLLSKKSVGRWKSASKVLSSKKSAGHWKSAIKFLSFDKSVVLGDAVTLPLGVSPVFSLDIRTSFELDRMLGNGEVIGELETTWDELLDHGNEPFNLSFPPVLGVSPSLTLKAAVVHSCDNQDSALLDSTVDCKIGRDADAGHAQFAEYVSSKMVSRLNGAVEHFQSVLDQCPVDHPDRASALTDLACVRLKGYIQGDFQDIDFVTSLFREALALRPQGHPDHPLSLYHLTEALNWRYSEEGTAVYIQESAQMYCKLLPLCPEGTYLRGIAAGENGVDYVINKCNNLPTDASDEDIHLRRIVLQLCSLGHQHRPNALNKLSSALRSRFKQCGSIDDLDECIQFRREAISLCPEGHTNHETYLNNLAFSLQYRFDHQGKSHDLDEAISLFEALILLRPVGHKYRDTALDNLGRALSTRFRQCGDVDDINRAVSLRREALTLRPPGNSSRDKTLNNLALVLQTRYVELDASEDLDEAIDLYRESLRLTRLDDPTRHRTLYNLSSALSSRFTKIQKNEDVEEAIALCQESLEALPSLHPERYFSYTRLQEAYSSRYRHHNIKLEDFQNASRRLLSGLAKQKSINMKSALEAYQMCLELFDSHVITRSSIISRREAATAFRDARSLPVDAASCAIRCDNLRQAVELVDQGRGQQWTLASRLRTPLDDLESTSPELARKFSELSRCLSDAQGAAVGTDRAAVDRGETQYRRLTEQWGAVVVEIRNLEGFSRFLLSPSYEDLQAAARHGPVIILIASQYSCSALVVPTSGEHHHVHFPDITLTHLKRLKADFAKAIKQAVGMRPQERRKDLQELLRIVWDKIMLPIVNVLEGDLRLQHRSRIWLCPTADFTSIPLHAANSFRMKADYSGPEPCLEDLYICSYTPTISALIRSQQSMKKCVPSFVAIGQCQPGKGQGKALVAVDDELDLVCKLVPATANPTLSNDDATRAGARKALQQNTWVHLACHGKQDHEQPYDSHFAMRDIPLTLLDIMEQDNPHAEFAFLSACHTAVGDEETPDEVIHLAAGLQFSGFKSVIGTLWEVDDAVVKHVVKAFYEKMFEDLEDGGVMDCTKAALALNHATYVVKKKVPLEQRIVFIHIGV